MMPCHLCGLQNWVWDVLTVISVVTVGSMSPASIWRIASQSDSLHKIFSCWRKISFFFFKYFKLHLSSKLSPISSSSLKISLFSYNPSTSHPNIFLFINSSFSLLIGRSLFALLSVYLNLDIFEFLNILLFRKGGSTKSNPPAPLSCKQSTPLSNSHSEYVVIAFCFLWAPVPGGIPHCVCTTQDTWKTDKAPRFRDFNYFCLYLCWKQFAWKCRRWDQRQSDLSLNRFAR